MAIQRCKNFTGIVVTEPPNSNDMLVARLRCKQWSCDYCAHVNQVMWRSHIIKRIAALAGTWTFITVTAHESAHKAGKTLENLRDGWNKLYHRLRRKFADQKPEYVRVFEKHKSGKFHIHAIVRVDPHEENKEYKTAPKFRLPGLTKWLKKNARECGLGFQAHAVKIPDNGTGTLVAAYITKYMTKSAQALGEMPKGLRRIQTTQGIGACKPDVAKHDWRIRAGVYLPDVQEHDHVTDISTGEVVPEYYFKTYLYWPEHASSEE